ncbi:5-oxoprolinase subunit B family protein [Maritalea sp.]|uniref:5-oxoprolinase subunit B family protein n=1 Tax=Maritalea sp. TaxID=2003361 RepID=UPI003EF1C58A
MGQEFQTEEITARLIPLGDRSVLVRFGSQLTIDANKRAQSFAKLCQEKLHDKINGCSSNLVSVIIQYDPNMVSFDTLKGQIMMLMSTFDAQKADQNVQTHHVQVKYGGEEGPCLDEVCKELSLSVAQFVEVHTANALHALALGFSPGFLYLGLHDEELRVPRRVQVQENVPAGSILFAAGQTAITSRPIRTGWHVIGRTNLRNFIPDAAQPILITPGDLVQFEAVTQL